MENNLPEENKLETKVPKFLLNPSVLVVLIAVGFGGYWLVSLVQNITSQKVEVFDTEFQAMCQKDIGELAWMKMIPIRDGKKISDEACFGCMFDDDNMICDRNEYENLKAQKR